LSSSPELELSLKWSTLSFIGEGLGFFLTALTGLVGVGVFVFSFAFAFGLVKLAAKPDLILSLT